MNYFESINAFIEGELETEKEGELFLALSSSEELRGQMKQVLAVNSVLKNKAAMTVPPAASTNAVFSALGVGLPAADAGLTPEKPAGRRGFFGKYSRGFVSGVAASIICFLLYFTLFQPNNDSNELQAALCSTITANKLVHESNDVPFQNAVQDIPVTVSEKPTEKIVYKYVYIEKEPEKPATNDNSNVILNSNDITVLEQDAPLADYKLSIEHSDLSYNDANIEVNTLNQQYYLSNDELMANDISVSPIDDIIAENDDNFINYNKIGIIAEFTGSQVWMLPEATISPKYSQLFNNNTIALFRPLSRDFMIGAEVRQENFFQRYRGVDKLGISNTYEQQPNLTTISAAARWTFTDFGIIDPYIQLTGGGNEVGQVARAMMGLTYAPYDDFAFVLGIEYSRLFYHHLERAFQTDKLSLNYGISFRF